MYDQNAQSVVNAPLHSVALAYTAVPRSGLLASPQHPVQNIVSRLETRPRTRPHPTSHPTPLDDTTRRQTRSFSRGAAGVPPLRALCSYSAYVYGYPNHKHKYTMHDAGGNGPRLCSLNEVVGLLAFEY